MKEFWEVYNRRDAAREALGPGPLTDDESKELAACTKALREFHRTHKINGKPTRATASMRPKRSPKKARIEV